VIPGDFDIAPKKYIKIPGSKAVMKRGIAGIFGKELFWDVRIELLDIMKDKYFIIERVMRYGSEADEKALYKTYKKWMLRRALKKYADIDKDSLIYFCAVLGVREEVCACYGKKLYPLGY
jgi:hypothetical protein